MTTRNAVRDDSQQLRDIQELIAKLQDVNRLLALPVRAMSASQVMTMPETEPADVPSA